jgi:hypothetical protein
MNRSFSGGSGGSFLIGGAVKLSIVKRHGSFFESNLACHTPER